jgi:hypothetical protein
MAAGPLEGSLSRHCECEGSLLSPWRIQQDPDKKMINSTIIFGCLHISLVPPFTQLQYRKQ